MEGQHINFKLKVLLNASLNIIHLPCVSFWNLNKCIFFVKTQPKISN